MRKLKSSWLSWILVLMTVVTTALIQTSPAVAATVPVPVNINAPAQVALNADFTASVGIGEVTLLDAGTYTVTFDPAVLRLDSVTAGSIGGTAVPVDGYNQTVPGTCIVVNNLPGVSGVTGSGILSVLHFHVLGTAGQTSNINLSNGTLSDSNAAQIPATWTGSTVTVSGQSEQFTLTVNVSGNGSVTKSPDQTSYASGTVVTLTPVPSTGYHFVNWTGDITGSANPATITMNANKFLTANFAADAPDWWNSGWSRRAPITVTERTGAALTDYQVKITVPYDSDMKTNFADIRFIDSTNTIELSYWMESSTVSSAIFWVKIPSIPASGAITINMYYGNPSAVAAGNIHTTFIFGDDFNDSAWTTANIHQTNYNSAVQGVESGEYSMSGPSKGEPIAEVYSNGALKQFPLNYIAEINFKPITKYGGAYIDARYRNVNYKYEQVIDIQEDGVELSKVVNGNWSDIGSWLELSSPIQAGTWYKMKGVVLREGTANRLQIFLNDSQLLNRTDSSLSDNGLAFLTYDYNNSFHVHYDNFRVRAYVATEPIFTIGPEQQSGAAQYTLSVSVIGSGTVTKNPDQSSYALNTSVQLTATAAPGWTFASWNGDLTGTTNPSGIIMNANKNVTATFTQNVYTLTVNTIGTGTVNRNNNGPYHYGDIVQLTAVPGPYSNFSGWSGDASGFDNPVNIIIDNNKTVTAIFTQNGVALTVNIVGSGSVARDPDQAGYTPGTSVQLTATAALGWTFAGWSGDLSGNISPANIIMDAPKTVTATFTQNIYALTVNTTGSGTVNLSNNGPYHYGDVVQLTAVPASGWGFANWTGDAAGTANPVSVTIDGNKTITANFTQASYTLTINITGQGTITKNPDQANYLSGTSVQLTAIAAPGWTFNGWSGSLTGNVNPANILMDGNKTVTATFTQTGNPPTVVTSAATNITRVAARLNGNLTALGSTTPVSVSFEWGLTTAYGNTSTTTSRTTTGTFYANISGLTAKTTYHFRAKAVAGGNTVYGTDLTVTTLPAPRVTTKASTNVTAYTATLNGTLNSKGSTTGTVNVSFEWGLTTAYGNTTPNQGRTSTGNFSAAITGLSPATTYHFRARAVGSGSNGTGYGADLTFTTTNSSGSAWWNTSWNRRASITITETSGSNLTDFQVKINVPYDSAMKSDFSDIRFVNGTGSSELSYWMESSVAGTSAVYWVKVPSIPASGTATIYIYYENASAASTGNIHNTFIFGDDFEDAAWTSSHIHQETLGPNANQGIQTVNGNHVFNQSGDNTSTPANDLDEPIAEAYSNGSLMQFPANYIAEIDFNAAVKYGGAYFTGRYDTVSDKYEQTIDIQNDQAILNKVVGDSWSNLQSANLGSSVQTNTWYNLKAVLLREGSTNRLQVFLNGTQYINQTDSSLSYNGLAFLTFNYNGPFNASYDNFRVRQYAAQEPTSAIGTVEQRS